MNDVRAILERTLEPNRVAPRFAFWQASSLACGMLVVELTTLLARLGGDSRSEPLEAAAWYLALAIYFWPPQAVALLVWVLLDRGTNALERPWWRLAGALALLALLSGAALGFSARLGFPDGKLRFTLTWSLWMWLAMLLPRLAFPFLRPGAFRRRSAPAAPFD